MRQARMIGDKREPKSHRVGGDAFKAASEDQQFDRFTRMRGQLEGHAERRPRTVADLRSIVLDHH
jgi:hypothetical protein